MAKYSPSKIESKWQKYWERKKLHLAKDNVTNRKNHMLLTEFPYPSGNLHIGHWYAFALPDTQARYLRMKGLNVLYPIGFDAFGLPAENAAIKHNINPREWTEQNISYMSRQFKSMGAMFDWSRVVSTIDPAYYKWTQWMFLKMFQKGLAYRKKTLVNWCPKDKTVLANEQVVNGCCERCDTSVVQKELTQWLFKITAYADRLVDDIEGLDWPETTKLAQKNWIGRSQGANIKFQVPSSKFSVEVFTTRPDTVFGVTHVVLSPEHPLLKKLGPEAKNSGEVEQYIQQSKQKTELQRVSESKEKTGVLLEGISAVNPATGKKVPVWVADYVLGWYGTGAVMAVPAHDDRDFEFAGKYKIPVRTVIRPALAPKDFSVSQAAFTDDGVLVNSKEFSGLTSADARQKITDWLNGQGSGSSRRTYRLHDWVLSRQRYWGVPIPMIHCPTCGYQPVPDRDLPVKLPPLKDFKPSDLPAGRQATTSSPLAKAAKWVKVKCPKCKGWAERETDTMDTFVDSSWYFMRYADPKNNKKFAEPAKMKKWLPVPMYIGGPEHNTMHLLYSRFFTKVLYDLGYVQFNEPFTGRRNHGIVTGPDGKRMSKSRGNVVDPDVEVKRYGADTVRMYLAFMAPYEQAGPWDPKGIVGVRRFLDRVWRLFQQPTDNEQAEQKEVLIALHQAVKNVGEDISHLRLNTGVSELMKLLNEIEKNKTLSIAGRELFVKILAPFAPHLAEELWQTVLKKKKSVHLEKWPEYDTKLLVSDTIDLPIQVNGKVRDVLKVSADIEQDKAQEMALTSENVKRHIEGKEIKKVIYIPGKMVSIVAIEPVREKPRPPTDP